MKDLIRYSDETDEQFNARKIWYSFCNSVLYENRFFVNHELLDWLKNYCIKNTIELKEGSLFFRARIIDDKAKKDHMLYNSVGAPDVEIRMKQYCSKKNTFRGLTKEASFVPPENVQVKEGRANPKYIRYLYMSEDPITALFEVRPFLYNAVNLAGIMVNKRIKIANIAVDIDCINYKDKSINEHLLSHIQGAFSKPTNNTEDYIVSQIIAEYIKKLGYDGIRYRSSLHREGVNYTVFSFEKCEAVSSQDFRIENFKITARAAIGSAEFTGDLRYVVDNEPKYTRDGKLKEYPKNIKELNND